MTPKLRFKGFPNYHKRKLADFTEKVARKASIDSIEDIRMISQGNGFILQSDKYSRENAGKSLKDYTLLKRGEFAYNHGASKAKPYGVCYRLAESDSARVPFVYHTFRLTEGVPDYWNYALNTDNMDRELKRLVSSGARMDGLLNISYESYTGIAVNYPCFAEQQKIADFLTAYDEKVSLQQQKVEALEKRKKGLLQKVFSQEIRFKADDGSEFPEWEEETIGDLMEVTSVKRVHESDWVESGVPFYRAREIVALHNGESVSPLYISETLYADNIKKCGTITEGDLLVTGVGTVGIQYLVKSNDRFYFKDGNIIWLKKSTCSRLIGEYLYYLFDSEFIKKQIRDMAGIGTVATYTIENAKRTKVCIPTISEQEKIADFFSAIDEQIGLEKQRLEAMQTVKKGLLQQLFCDGSEEEEGEPAGAAAIYQLRPQASTLQAAAPAAEYNKGAE